MGGNQSCGTCDCASEATNVYHDFNSVYASGALANGGQKGLVEYVPDTWLVPQTFPGIFIDRSAFRDENKICQKSLDPSLINLNDLFPVAHALSNGVPRSLSQFRQQLKLHSFCEVDFEQLGIPLFNSTDLESGNQWEAVHKLSTQLKRLFGDDAILTGSSHSMDIVYNEMHQDHGGETEILKIWIPLRASKRLVMRSNANKRLFISEAGKAVIFYSYVKDQSCRHAGCRINGDDHDVNMIDVNHTGYNSMQFYFGFVPDAVKA